MFKYLNNLAIKYCWGPILDFLFPRFCLGCGREGEWLCPSCREKILAVKTQVCPACGRISPKGSYCASDRYFKEIQYIQGKRKEIKTRRSLGGIIVSAYYEEGPIKEAIHNFKYNNIVELKNILGDVLAATLKENLDLAPKEEIMLTAVPLHFIRRAQRGYNQSELLADYVATKLNLAKNFRILRKIRWTKPQVKLGGEKRLKNLENSFKIVTKITKIAKINAALTAKFPRKFRSKNHKNREKKMRPLKNDILFGKTIILVDDVATTGATLNECAKVLKKAGAKEVWGLVVAKG